jgi:spermidine/putrescine transport system substrate-binding protein
MKRATLYLLLGLIIVLWAVSGCTAPTTTTKITVINWQGYGSDESWALEIFKEKYGIEIVHDYYNSNEELLTKLRTSPGTYDAVGIGVPWTVTAIEEGLLQPIDTNSLANFNDLNKDLVESPLIRDGEDIYAIPFAWGATGIAYNKDKIPDGIDSMQAFWDPEYAGKVSWQDYYYDNVMFASIALGQDPNYPSDLEAVKSKLLDLMPQVKTFWSSEDEFNKLFASEEIILGTYWSGSSSRAQKFGLPLEFVIPKEGGIGWFDAWAIPAGAPNKDAALKWLDFLTSPEFYLEWDKRVGAPVPSNNKTVAELPNDSLNKNYLSQPDVFARLTFYDVLTEEQMQQRVEIWQEVKASK